MIGNVEEGREVVASTRQGFVVDGETIREIWIFKKKKGKEEGWQGVYRRPNDSGIPSNVQIS